MELRRILAVALGLALIVLSVAPYIKARELTMETPSGWEVLGSKRLKVPLKELQEIYAPDGTPTGRYGRPIDHGWFGEGKLIEIGGTRIWILDTYQDARGCHVRVRVENLEGELTTAGGQSQGVQWGNLRLYITWAKFPPEEGDWRTAKGEYFYGFEEFELTLYRVPTAPAIPLSAAGAVLGVGLVLFGVAVIREGERRGILPILIGSAFLCALIIRFPGYEAVQPVATYARVNWLGGWTIATDRNFSRFAVLSQDNLSLYDNYGNRIWTVALPAGEVTMNWTYWVTMSSDGSRILISYYYSPAGINRFRLYDGNGNLLLTRSSTRYGAYPWMSANGGRIAYGDTENKVVVVDSAGNIVRTFDFSTTYSFVPYVQLNDDGSRLCLLYVPYTNACGVAVYNVATGQKIFDKLITTTEGYRMPPMISKTGKYVLVENFGRNWAYAYALLYNVDTGSLLWKSAEGEKNWGRFGWAGCCTTFSADDSRVAVCLVDSSGSSYVKIIGISPDGTSATVLNTYSCPEGYGYSISPSGDKVVAASYSSIFSVGPNSWQGTLPIPTNYMPFPICSDNEVILTVSFGQWARPEVFLMKFRYSLSITAALPCISVDGAPATSSYSVSENPAQRRVVDLVPYENYVVVGTWGNFTDMDNVKLAENRLEIYMDNDKSILIGLLGRPGTPAVSPAKPRPSENVVVTWTTAPYYIGTSTAQVSGYELQVDNEENFSHPTTYTAISGTSFTLEPPAGGWQMGRYWVRVRAYVTGSTIYGNWSDPAYFEISMPSPSWLRVTPSRPMYDENVTLEWEPVALADYYRVKLRLGESENIVIPYTTQTTCVLSPPAGGWVAPARYDVGVCAVSYTYGESAWTENYFYTQPVVGPPGPVPPPPRPPAPGKLQLAAMVPMLPHPIVSAFNTLGQIAGVYTLSLLMVLGGLGLITMGLRKVP